MGITLSLNERIRLYKKFKKVAFEKRWDVAPSSFLAWMETQDYLNADKIHEDLAKEKEILDKNEQS